ncbi:hypothetical protein SALBM217S_10431 [Streptomyces griseoloalbus]
MLTPPSAPAPRAPGRCPRTGGRSPRSCGSGWRSRRGPGRSACRSRTPTRSCPAGTRRSSRPAGRPCGRRTRRRQLPGEVVLALGVVDGAVGADHVGERGAVLGDVDPASAVLVREAQQEVLDAAGVDLPVHAGALHAVPADGGGVGGGPVGVGGDHLREVVVEADPVERDGNGLEVAGPFGEFDGVDLAHVLGEAPAVDRVEPPAVGVAVHAEGGGAVLGAVARRVDGGEVVDDADLRVGGGGADGARGKAELARGSAPG